MNDRSAVDTMTLARDYLDSLLAGGPEIQGDWLVQNVKKCTCGTPSVAAYGHEPYCGYEPLTDDPLIVALRATAPAIRALLSAESGAYALATAILATSHAEKWITKRESNRVDEIEREQFARDHIYDNPE